MWAKDGRMAYEIKVHDDGDTEVRQVPPSYHSGTTIVCSTAEETVKELVSYGHDKPRVQMAMEEVRGAILMEWVTL